jgi:hypothetical protein
VAPGKERHAQLAADLGHFKDPATGEPMVYAAKAWRRCLADLFYLSRVRLVGQGQAGVETCETYGHEGGMRCIRCGALVQ